MTTPSPQVKRDDGGNGQSPVFDPDGEACHVALQQLHDVLDHLGFSVRKKAASEATLRVYLRGYGRYPLLNPRFHSHATCQGKYRPGGFLVLLSKGDDHLDQQLRGLPLEYGLRIRRDGSDGRWVPASRRFRNTVEVFGQAW